MEDLCLLKTDGKAKQFRRFCKSATNGLPMTLPVCHEGVVVINEPLDNEPFPCFGGAAEVRWWTVSQILQIDSNVQIPYGTVHDAAKEQIEEDCSKYKTFFHPFEMLNEAEAAPRTLPVMLS